MSGLTAAPAKKPVIDVFTASGTWDKPSGYDENHIVTVMVWGAGGGGNAYSGGGGGAYSELKIRMGDIPASVPIQIGAGGTADTNLTGGRTAGAGGNSTFGSLLTGFGGSAGSGFNGGSGASEFSRNANDLGGGSGGNSGPGSNASTPFAGGGGGGSSNYSGGGSTVFGGGGGGGWDSSSNKYGARGKSLFGGNGGSNSNGAIPAGGGSAKKVGARGEVRLVY